MNRDPSVVSFTRVGAEVIAGVVGGFVDTLSWRSLVRLSQMVSLCLDTKKTNVTLVLLRLPCLGFSHWWSS